MNLFSLKFWFALQPVPLLPLYEFILLGIFSFLVVFAIVLRIVFLRKKSDPLLAKRLKHLRQMFLVMGVIGLAFLFFTYERAFILGARFWYLLWAVVFLVWLVFILRDLFKKMPHEKEEKRRKEIFEKYLPRPKSKR